MGINSHIPLDTPEVGDGLSRKDKSKLLPDLGTMKNQTKTYERRRVVEIP